MTTTAVLFFHPFLRFPAQVCGLVPGAYTWGTFCAESHFFLRKSEKTWRRRDTKEGGWEQRKETRRSVFSVFARVRSAGGEKIKVETLLLKFGQCKKRKKGKSRGGGEKRKKRHVSCCPYAHARSQSCSFLYAWQRQRQPLIQSASM